MKLPIIDVLCICAIVYMSIACSQRQPGPLERAGERTDEIVDNVEKGKPPLHRKGPAEKFGESLDQTLGTDRN